MDVSEIRLRCLRLAQDRVSGEGTTAVKALAERMAKWVGAGNDPALRLPILEMAMTQKGAADRRDTLVIAKDMLSWVKEEKLPRRPRRKSGTRAAA